MRLCGFTGGNWESIPGIGEPMNEIDYRTGAANMLTVMRAQWVAGKHWCCDAHQWVRYPQERCGYCQYMLDTRYPHLSALRTGIALPRGGMARATQEAKALRRRMARDATRGRRGARAIEHQLVDPVLDAEADLFDPRLPRRSAQ